MALGLSEPSLWLHRCPRAQKLGTKETRAPCSPLQLTVDVLLNFLVQHPFCLPDSEALPFCDSQHISTLMRKLFPAGCIRYSLRMGFKPLVFFARYLAGRLERPAVLPCVAQTGVVSPVGGDQAPRYHPWVLL